MIKANHVQGFTFTRKLPTQEKSYKNDTPSERNTFHCARCFHSVLVCLRICVEHKKLVSFFSEMYFYVRIFMEISVVRFKN